METQFYNGNTMSEHETPLPPWGSYERSISPYIYPVSPSEQAASAAYWEYKESFAIARRKADERARDNYIERDRD